MEKLYCVSVPAGVWFVTCHHMVSLQCSLERCEARTATKPPPSPFRGCPSNRTQGVRVNKI